MCGNTVNDGGGTDDAPNVKIFREFDAILFFYLETILLIGNVFTGVDKDLTPDFGFPSPIFNVFVTVHDEPSPRLTDGYDFHHYHSFRISNISQTLFSGIHKPILGRAV